MASKKSGKRKPKCSQHSESTESNGKQPKPPVVADPINDPAVPNADELTGITALDDGAPTPGVEFCENCGQSIDINSAEAIICPECGGLGSDECCMDRGEDEPCKLCRQEMEDEIPDKEDKEDEDEDDDEEDGEYDDEDEDEDFSDDDGINEDVYERQ
jgi:hypothetical protein